MRHPLLFVHLLRLATVVLGCVASDAAIGQQVYWDKKVAPTLQGACEQQLASIRQQYGKPELMAIGDSIYNGVQSLRMNWWLAEWSVPVYVAIRLGLVTELRSDRTGERSFYAPQYPTHGKSYEDSSNFGFNLEDIKFLDLAFGKTAAQQAALLENLAFVYKPDNRRPVVENLAFAGANTVDLLEWKAGDFKKYARTTVTTLKESEAFKDVGDAFFYANAYFILNPTRSSCLDNLTVLDQVKLRQPRRLLINVGANNGLWRLAMDGVSLSTPTCGTADDRRPSASGFKHCDGSIENLLGKRYLADVEKMLRRLIDVDRLEAVYFNGLIRPSQTANLVYARGRYTTALFDNPGVTGAEVKKSDKFVHDVNRSIASLIDRVNAEQTASGKALKFTFVDTEATIDKYDYKGCLIEKTEDECKSRRMEVNGRRFGIGQTQYFDNLPLQAIGDVGVQTGEKFKSKIAEGGLFSWDNMHPSSAGYEILANAVTGALEANKDPDLKPLRIAGQDPCKSRSEPGFSDMKPGHCVNLIMTPGWSYADVTRREFMLARIAGGNQTTKIDLLRFLRSLVSRFAQ